MGLKELIDFGDKIKQEVEKTVQDEIKSTISAYKSIVSQGRLQEFGVRPIYASGPITTGFRLYEALEKYNVKTIEELVVIDPDIRKKIMDANIRDGMEFADEIRSKERPLVINPGDFFAKGWTQVHYMGLWEPVIKEFAPVLDFNYKFHYSDGSVEELLIGLRNDKELRTRKFKRLVLKDEIPLIEDAINHIDRIIGQVPQKLFNLYKGITEFV